MVTIGSHRDISIGANRHVVVRNHSGVSFAPSGVLGRVIGGPFTRFRAIIIGSNISFSRVSEGFRGTRRSNSMFSSALRYIPSSSGSSIRSFIRRSSSTADNIVSFLSRRGSTPIDSRVVMVKRRLPRRGITRPRRGGPRMSRPMTARPRPTMFGPTMSRPMRSRSTASRLRAGRSRIPTRDRIRSIISSRRGRSALARRAPVTRGIPSNRSGSVARAPVMRGIPSSGRGFARAPVRRRTSSSRRAPSSSRMASGHRIILPHSLIITTDMMFLTVVKNFN